MSHYQERSGTDVVWGVRPSFGVGDSPAHKFALVAGLVYVAIGLLGFFFTGFDSFTEATHEALFGIFHVTPLHNVVHILIGAVWLLAALALTRPAAQGVNLAIAGFYVLAAVLGYIGALELLGVRAGLDADNFLHAATGVVALLFAGLIPTRNR